MSRGVRLVLALAGAVASSSAAITNNIRNTFMFSK
jgi:hypothetical protein